MDEIKVPSTRYHKIVNLLCIIILTGTLVFLVTNWTMIPDQIPGHYDSAGVINRWLKRDRNFLSYVYADHEIDVCGSNNHHLYERMEQLPVAEGYLTEQ